MKYLFKVTLLFLIVFNFRVPVIHYSCSVAVIIAGLYYLIGKKSFPLNYFFQRYCFVILAGTLLITFYDALNATMHGNIGGGAYARYLVQGWMLACLVFVLPILIEKKESAFNESLVVICGAFALQGLIHTLGFLIEPFGEFIRIFQGERMDQWGNFEINSFRLFSLTGSPFFDLPAAYGVAHIAFFGLQLDPNQNYLRGWKAFVVIVLMILGTMLSGRTGFIGFGLGLALYLFYNWSHFSTLWRNIIKITGGYLFLLVVFYTALTPSQQSKFVDTVFPFAFEAYYNWRDTGRFGTTSTDELNRIHYYPLEAGTILWGDGGNSYELMPKYNPTDAGYMNILMMGGIPYLLVVILYQLLFYWRPMVMAKRENSRSGDISFLFFFISYAHFFILEYKGGAIGSIHTAEVVVLYYGISYLVEQYALEDAEEEEDISSGELLNESVVV